MDSFVPEGSEQHPVVSIMIVTWNSSHLLKNCLTSLSEAADDVPYEVLIIDNGSTDDTIDYVARSWPGVSTTALPRNQGFGVANNVGFSRSRGDYILVLNPDTWAMPGMVRDMVKALQDDETIGCVGARHLNSDESLQWSMDDFPWFPNEALHYTDLYRVAPFRRWVEKKFPRWSDHTEEVDVDWVNGACMMVPRKVYSETGGFDEYFFLFAEELDWCLRIWQAGYRVRFLPEAVLIHELGGTFTSKDPYRMAMIYQSGMRYYRRNKSLTQYLGIVAVVRINAAVRLLILTVAAMAARLNVFSWSERKYQVVTQHSHSLSFSEAFQMWWNVLKVRTNSHIRPAKLVNREAG